MNHSRSENDSEQGSGSSRPLRILVADDDVVLQKFLTHHLQHAGTEVDVVADGTAAKLALQSEQYDLALVDIQMPGLGGLELLADLLPSNSETSVVMMTGHATVETAVQALRLGAVDFLIKPITPLDLDLALARSIRVSRLFSEQRQLRETIGSIQAVRGRNLRFVGESADSKRVLAEIDQAVEGDCHTILVTGETGTGKEVVAREIHLRANSERSPFIGQSCPALPDSLIESELFGHVKGAFTGASENRPGCFELANGGTLLLDEIGDLPGPAQAKLLRVLETRMVRRLGSAREKRIDLLVVAATNADLEQRIAAGTFRRDLYYRLNVYSIHLLPLRQRRDDILPLARHFLGLNSRQRGGTALEISREAEIRLRGYDYPGNARELRNIMDRAAILGRGELIRSEHLRLSSGTQPVAAAIEPTTPTRERERILEALEQARWNRRQAARALGMPYSTLRHKIEKLGLA